MQDINGDNASVIRDEGVSINGYVTERRTRECAQSDLISYLALTVLERLEEMESETALQRIKDLPIEQLDQEARSLTGEIAGLKARLKWIAEGM